jgi:hypothetical protein
MNPKLPIPGRALDQHTIVLGKTRSGKSSKLRLMVEVLLDAGHPACIIDPKGDWWGLKSSADGKKPGFSIIIFGGKHADIQINQHSGAHVAELVATGNRPCIIDLGGWRMGERTRFFIDFAQAFFIHTRGLRYLIIDECHNFVPKGKVFSPDVGEMLHWGNRLASEGQGKGIILLSASQRPQKVHNDYLTSHETLVACRVIHKADRDAIKDWIDGCGDPVVGKEMIGALAAMQRPEAWVWSPEIGFGPKRITFPMFRTYDSFQPQSARATRLKGWASVDLDDVKVRLAKVVEEVEANDPTKLKAEIVRLKKAASKPVEKTISKIVSHETIDPKALQKAREEGFRAAMVLIGESVGPDLETVQAAFRPIDQAVRAFPTNLELAIKRMKKLIVSAAPKADALVPVPVNVTVGPLRKGGKALERNGLIVSPRAARDVAKVVTGGDSTLSKAELAVLRAVAHFPGGVTSSKAAMFSGYSVKSSSFEKALSLLRTKELIERGQPITITLAGLDAAGEIGDLPNGPDLLAYWLDHQALAKAERALLPVIVGALPNAITRADIAEASGYSLASSSFEKAMSKLRTLELIGGRGDDIRAAEEFS